MKVLLIVWILCGVLAWLPWAILLRTVKSVLFFPIYVLLGPIGLWSTVRFIIKTIL